MTFNIESTLDSIENAAKGYEDAIIALQDSATEDDINIVNATTQTTNVQFKQSFLEMQQAAAKNASEHIKNQGRKLTS